MIGFLVDHRLKYKSHAMFICEKICKMNDFKGSKKNKKLIQEVVKLNAVKQKIPLEEMKCVIGEMVNKVLFSQV